MAGKLITTEVLPAGTHVEFARKDGRAKGRGTVQFCYWALDEPAISVLIDGADGAYGATADLIPGIGDEVRVID